MNAVVEEEVAGHEEDHEEDVPKSNCHHEDVAPLSAKKYVVTIKRVRQLSSLACLRKKSNATLQIVPAKADRFFFWPPLLTTKNCFK